MTKKKLFSVLTIVCFSSVLFIPIGIVLMWLYLDWKKKLKFLLTALTSLLYIGIIILMLLLEPANNTSGISLPFGTSKGSTQFETNSYSSKENYQSKIDEDNSGKSNKKADKQSEKNEKKVKITTKTQKTKNTRWIYPVLFFLFLLALIIWQNLRGSKKSYYENPYVDTNKYKLPFTSDTKMPLVHFLRLNLSPNEKIYFASETNQKDKEGDFVITNKRVVILNLSEGTIDLPLNTLTSLSSVTNSVISITSENQSYYVFMHESQVKFALAILKWAYEKCTNQTLPASTKK